MIDITKEQYDAYERVRASGQVNMLDALAVAILALSMCDVYLTKTEARKIAANYDELTKKFKEGSI